MEADLAKLISQSFSFIILDVDELVGNFQMLE